MRMIEPDDAEPTRASLALNLNEFFGGDLVPGSRGLSTGVGAADDFANQMVCSGDVTEQNSTALIGIRELPVSADRVEIVLRKYQHRRFSYPSARPEVC
jgi:hypothetical protein